jgi:hypothetical protein
MGFLDKAKAAAEQAATRVQEGVEDVQTKRDLAAAYGDLGRKAHELALRGAIANPELDPLVQRVTELESRSGAQPDGGGAPMTPEAATTPAPEATAPPPPPPPPPQGL